MLMWLLVSMLQGIVENMKRMTSSEAFVETLEKQGVKNIFGIVGSAYMDSLDIFPAAGIRFIPTVHEQGAAHMADGYSRVAKKHGVCIGQNGPGITNFVTAIAAAYWAHSPVVAITPETGSNSMGLGGFQETEQLPIFSKITVYQAHVNSPERIAELTARCFDYASMDRGPTQLNIPRNHFYGEADYEIPGPRHISLGAGAEKDLDSAASLLAKAKFPVIVSGGGVVMSGGQESLKKLAEKLGAPVVNSYLHNDSFPASHPLWCGPLGYQGSKAGMKLIKQADVILALGSRLGPFGTLPQHGLDYWPKHAEIIQIDSNHRVIGLVRPVHVGIVADASAATEALLKRLGALGLSSYNESGMAKKLEEIAKTKREWEAELDAWPHERDEWSTQMRHSEGGLSPRSVLRELEKAMPKDAMVSTDIGNICSVANSYLRFEQPQSFLAAMSFGNCGYALPVIIGAKVAAPQRPAFAYVGDGAWAMSFGEIFTCIRENIPVTAVVFNNRQWGAEKKNQVDFYNKRFLGSNLKNPSFSEIAKSMGALGICVKNLDEIADAMRLCTKAQSEGKTTVLEIMCSRELGDPFRRDALKKPMRLLEKYKSFV